MDLELDLSDDEEAAAERQLAGAGAAAGGHRTLARGRYEAIPLFSDNAVEEGNEPRRPLDVGPNKGRDGLGEADRDAWDRLG